jgi:hypothetical protein
MLWKSGLLWGCQKRCGHGSDQENETAGDLGLLSLRFPTELNLGAPGPWCWDLGLNLPEPLFHLIQNDPICSTSARPLHVSLFETTVCDDEAM